MNSDCLFIIFEHLDLTGLLNMARITDQFSMIAADVFRREYSHLRVEFDDSFVLPDNSNEWLLTDVKINADTFERLNRDLTYFRNHTGAQGGCKPGLPPLLNFFELTPLPGHQKFWIAIQKKIE